MEKKAKIKTKNSLRGLYAITDERLTPYSSIISYVKKALQGGAKIIQLRDKSKSDDELLFVAQAIKELCDSFGAFFIVNDRVDLAISSGADGVHIGKDDESITAARLLLGPEKIIGVSCYNDLERALFMEDAGADYVAFGSFFPSPTKPDAVRATVELLEKAKKELSIPICAIGGITLKNAFSLIRAGADMVAVISDLWRPEDKDIVKRASAFSRLFIS